MDNFKKEVVTHRALLLAMTVLLIGMYLNWLSLTFGQGLWATFLYGLGCSLFGTSAVVVGWELIMKRRFMSEIASAIATNTEVKLSGIESCNTDYMKFDWVPLIKNSHEMWIFVSYGQTWRNVHETYITNRLEAGKKMGVILPNFNNKKVVSELASRYGMKDLDLKNKIQEAAEIYKNMHSELVEVRLVNQTPLACYYKFDNKAVITIYKHQDGRGCVPAFLVQDGWMHEFVNKEFEALKSASEVYK